MNAALGVAPYDAMSLMAHKYFFKKFPFSVVRISYDFLVIIIGVLFGGKPNIGIILMALFLGPVISVVGKYLNKHVFHM